ncbi:MAG: Eco57I restriction-modification methylase domain-containing protein [Anaerolineaceae bacterium]|nr:Eco57I restriction-modification methylase domain-containing protein [Anaerolineaceae bacterium]
MADALFESVYNPDVLSCLANLSNDEVFTPPDVANAMLDMLPQKLFSDPDATFLDPACKSGVFLREIAKRLIVGLESKIPDLQERLDHIFHKQLYGIAITELTSLLARRSLYCSKYPNSYYSLSRFDRADGNIRYKRIAHSWKNGKCLYCGATQDKYDRDNELETHAYEWIHVNKPEDILGMKITTIISNPPYQLSDGGNNASAIPIYQKFIEASIKLNPKYLTMIIPSRWFSGGRGLDEFREKMLNDRSIKELYDFVNADDCFPGVDISGGVCYFLRDSSYNGPCKIVNVFGEKTNEQIRDLNQYKILVRSNEAIKIIEKVSIQKEKTIDEFVSSQKPFGLRTYERPDADGDYVLRWNGGKGPIQKDRIQLGQEMVNKWKVIVSRVFYEHAGKVDKAGQSRVLSILEVLQPGEVCTETYVVVKSFDTEEEAVNLYEYLKTKFARYLILQACSSIMITKNSFIFLPDQDFSRSWSDNDLFVKYQLSASEISNIESTIKPMSSEGEYDVTDE